MEWKLIAFRPIGRHRMRMEDYVQHDLKVKNTGESKLKIRNEWKRIVEQVRTEKPL
jgi:hypothetical protein